MSLNWSVKDIKNKDEVCFVPVEGSDKRTLHYVTDALIWATMGVDLGSITEKNIDKWQERLHILSQIDGGMLYDTVDGKRVDRNPTREELIAHIGLGTNVSTLSDTKWKNRVWKRMVQDAQRAVARGKRDLLTGEY